MIILCLATLPPGMESQATWIPGLHGSFGPQDGRDGNLVLKGQKKRLSGKLLEMKHNSQHRVQHGLYFLQGLWLGVL